MTIKIGDEIELCNIPKYLRVNNGDKGKVVDISHKYGLEYIVLIDNKRWAFPRNEIKLAK